MGGRSPNLSMVSHIHGPKRSESARMPNAGSSSPSDPCGRATTMPHGRGRWKNRRIFFDSRIDCVPRTPGGFQADRKKVGGLGSRLCSPKKQKSRQRAVATTDTHRCAESGYGLRLSDQVKSAVTKDPHGRSMSAFPPQDEGFCEHGYGAEAFRPGFAVRRAS